MKNKITENKTIDWVTWEYENNAPYALVKMSFYHSLSIGFANLIMSYIFAINKYNDIGKIISFCSLNFVSTFVFLFLSFLPLFFLHGIHYKIFKKILLKNKLEYTVIIGWLLIFTHFIIIYKSLDYLILKLNFSNAIMEPTFLSAGYLFGLVIGFITFNNQFYAQKKIDNTKDINIWKKYMTKEERFFG